MALNDKQKKVKITIPWHPGPNDNEWDSPGYNDFWHNAEMAVNKKIADAKVAGKEVIFVDNDGKNISG